MYPETQAFLAVDDGDEGEYRGKHELDTFRKISKWSIYHYLLHATLISLYTIVFFVLLAGHKPATLKTSLHRKFIIRISNA
jgi:hypothetical protein